MTTVDNQRHRENEKICRTSASRRGTADLRFARGGGRANAALTRRSVDNMQKALGRAAVLSRSLPISLMEQGEALNRTHTRMTPMTRCFRVSVVNN